jgi:hypothetical protein
MARYKWSCETCGSEVYMNKNSRLPIEPVIEWYCYKTRNKMIEFSKFNSVTGFNKADVIMCKFGNPVEVKD